MGEKVPAKMAPFTFGVVKNTDKTLFVSTDLPEPIKFKGTSKVVKHLSPNHKYNCTGTLSFCGVEFDSQNFSIETDYGGKYNAYFSFGSRNPYSESHSLCFLKTYFEQDSQVLLQLLLPSLLPLCSFTDYRHSLPSPLPPQAQSPSLTASSPSLRDRRVTTRPNVRKLD